MKTNLTRRTSPIIYILILFLLAVTSCSKDGKTADESVAALKAKADSVVNQMYEYSDAHRYAESIEAGKEALRLYEQLKDTMSISDVLGEISASHMRLGNAAEGLEYSFRAIELDSIKKNYDYLSGDYNTIASIYQSEGKPAEAEPFILRAIEYELMTEDKLRLSNRYGIASEIYCKLRRIDEAVAYATKGYDIAVERKDTAQIATRMSQLADTYFADKRYDKAEEMYKKCIGMMQSQKSMISLAITYKQLGSICEKRNDIEHAIAYYEKGAELARKTQYTMLLMMCTQSLGDLTAATRPSYAVQMLQESRALADTMHSQKVADMMASFAAKYDRQEKERTIAEQSDSLRTHKRIIWVGTFILVLLLAVIVLNLYMYRLLKHNEKLQTGISKKIVEEAQHVAPQVVMSESDQKFLADLAVYVKEHLGESNLSTATLAEAFCMSPRQFSRRVKQLTDIDTTHYIRASRMLYARQLLSETTLPISEIYVKCGFESANYFSRVFRQDVGVTPTEYRENTTKNS